jgi:hypothetical protein
MRWANSLAPSAESRRALGTGPDDCVSSGASASKAAIDTLALTRLGAAVAMGASSYFPRKKWS